MSRNWVLLTILSLALLPACGANTEKAPNPDSQNSAAEGVEFRFDFGRFADKQVLAYKVPGFNALTSRQKELLYYLYQASYSGRDIMYDQNYKYNLRVRRTLEAIVRHYSGDRENENFRAFMDYTRQVWFSNGIHHHYSTLKLQPNFSRLTFTAYVSNVEDSGDLPLLGGESVDEFLASIAPILFDPSIAPKKVDTTPNTDKVTASAVNFYEDVTEQEVRDFYAARAQPTNATPVSKGLNSKLIKNKKGGLEERVWKVGGMYTEAIEAVVYWLEKAIAVAENDKQRKAFELLVEYYRSGDLEDFDKYSVAWVEDTESRIDLISGFIEVYNDPIAYRGSFESVVSFRDEETTKRIAAIGDRAQWFEDNMPFREEYKRRNVQGILGKAITVVAESGDASPATPTGINLPNSDWIRANHGSKSVTITNIFSAYYAFPDKSLLEFAWDEEEIERAHTYGKLGTGLLIDMHEVIGHASGKLNPGVGTPKETLKQYASTSEEGRADLVALYYIMDPKLVDIGVMPNLEVGKTVYDRYIRGGLLTQLYRIKPGEVLEEAHMRNRALVAQWVYEKGRVKKVIERREREGKTYFVINDYKALRDLFGELLAELQRIKSEGDFASIAQLVETYGTQVDDQLHKEVIKRYAPLNIAAFKGFVNPIMTPVKNDTEIVDVILTYPASFDEQMMHYAKTYSHLPHIN